MKPSVICPLLGGLAVASAHPYNQLELRPGNVQNASTASNLEDGQSGFAASATDNANFINYCSGKTLTNGQVLTGGSCNGIVMGEIPSVDKMISTIIKSPHPGEKVKANTDFKVQVHVDNLAAGSFTNPFGTYYSAPQTLNKDGKIIGHVHIAIQSLGDTIAPSTGPDPAKYAFFARINDAGDVNGNLETTVKGGLPEGAYRVCTMTAAANHQPVVMPVAQRGAQDDCTKFVVEH